MKKLLLFLTLIITSAVTCLAQTDKVYKHNGEVLEVQVKEISASIIKYSFPNETLLQSLGKYAVAKIVYSSGREEKISDFIKFENSSDFEKCIILASKDEAVGLIDKGEVVGKTAAISYQTPGTANKASLNRIRKAAMELGAPFILIEENTTSGARGQAIRRGRAFGYK
jgi:hypothetical protein